MQVGNFQKINNCTAHSLDTLEYLQFSDKIDTLVGIPFILIMTGP